MTNPKHTPGPTDEIDRILDEWLSDTWLNGPVDPRPYLEAIRFVEGLGVAGRPKTVTEVSFSRDMRRPTALAKAKGGA